MKMLSSPAKRRRTVTRVVADPESDVESLDVHDSLDTTTLGRKRKRYSVPDDSDQDGDFQDFPSNESSAPSLAVSLTATAAVADTPMTDASTTYTKSKKLYKPREKKFPCPYPDCGKAYDRPVRLQTHINTHTGERPHVCDWEGCDKSFFKSEHLKAHIQQKHSNDRSFACTFEVRDDVSGQIRPCGKTFPTTSKLKNHIAMHEQKEETTCSWEGCGKIFRRQETLQRHIKKEHLDELPYVCTRETAGGHVCNEAFATPSQLKSHNVREHEALRYWCEMCTDAGNAVPTQDPWPLNDLDPAFLPTAEDLVQPPADDQLPQASTPNAQSNGVVAFATYAELQLHNKHVHPPTCTECGKRCRSNRELEAHIDIDHLAPELPPGATKEAKRYPCPHMDCERARPDNGFTRRGNLDVHITRVHVNEKKFICGEFDIFNHPKLAGWNGRGCGLALGTKQTLIGHVRTKHMGMNAGLSARNGLRDEDRVRPLRRKVKRSDSASKSTVKHEESPSSTVHDHPQDSSMFIDSTGNHLAPTHPDSTLALLTGAGYDILRPIPCLLAPHPHSCQMRFTRQYDLAVHLELTHGWNVDDVHDALNAEQAPAVALDPALANGDVQMLDL